LDLADGPSATREMAMIWDPVRARILTYNGWDGSTPNDIWALTLGPKPSWTRVTTSGPSLPPSYGFRGVYDPSGDRLVFLAIAWEPDYQNGGDILHNWIYELPLSGPNALQWWIDDVFPPEFIRRRGASFTYDAGRDVAWIFGGADGQDVALGDVWRVDLAGTPTVSLVTTTTDLLLLRSDHAAIFDDARDRLIVVGGRSGNVLRSSDPYQFEPGAGNAWSVMAARGPRPPARAWPAYAYDATSERLVMLGGTGSTSALNDTWALSIGLETLPVEGPPAPASLSLAPVGGNPMRADVAMSLSLPSAGRGSLALLDVSGRRVRSVSLDGIAPGPRTIALARRGEIAPGLYFAVLHHASGERHARVIVLP
jgi:galactose oxidase-like protein